MRLAKARMKHSKFNSIRFNLIQKDSSQVIIRVFNVVFMIGNIFILGVRRAEGTSQLNNNSATLIQKLDSHNCRPRYIARKKFNYCIPYMLVLPPGLD